MVPGSREAEDNARFVRWVREHGHAVRGYLFAISGNRDLAEELAQEVFCKAWRARRRYREQGNARAYLLRIADRLVRDRGRKAAREVTLDEERWRQIEPVSHVPDPSQAAAQAEAERRLMAALETLTPAQRRVLLLRYYGQLSFSEIAEILNCPLNTALSHCHRGLTALRRVLVHDAAFTETDRFG
jgi:RNA polymerase sigma-70 factor (ECF subfamily)